MKKFLAYVLLLQFAVTAIAQQETLTPLGFNPPLYHSTKRFIEKKHKYLIDKAQYVVATDTLILPFSDDFSKNKLRGYKWLENNITDTFYNVIGTCLANEGIETQKVRVMYTPSWQYSYDIVNQKVDSTQKPSVTYTFFGPGTSGCFRQTPQQMIFWDEYYRYTFDTNGLAIDSFLVPADDSFDVAPVIYFVANEPGTLWTDNFAYVNNTYPILPPTIGVATLDGLNEYGLPYNNSNPFTYGDADKLTSKPINLSGLSESDSVYLSFFFEGKGLGESPDVNDSLVLEFKDNAGFWRIVWSKTGYSTVNPAPNVFEQVLVKVPNLSPPYNYFHNNFQFRFRNKASLYGNLDHWHIDYVRFDKNRSAVDTLIQDVAFVYPFPTMLKNFTQLPADQFNPATDFADNIELLVHNMDPNAINNPPATNFRKSAVQLYPLPSVVATEQLQTFNAGPYSNINVNPAAEYSLTNSVLPVDSMVLRSLVFVEPFDSRPVNDTLYRIQSFSTVMAYDDGSAETAYGITGTQTKKFAYEFNLHQPDTLVGFQIMYSQVSEDVSNLVFNFHVWDSLKLNDFNFQDIPVVSIENRKPHYVDSVNGFTTYILDTPIIFQQKIYLGWAQTDTRSLQIGYDLNSPLGNSHMYVYKDSKWQPTIINTPGSPMMRLIFDSDYWGGGTSIKNLAEERLQLHLFPNPNTGTVFIANAKNKHFTIAVLNLLGETVKYISDVTSSFNISELSSGVYVVLATDSNGKTFRNKIIKTLH